MQQKRIQNYNIYNKGYFFYFNSNIRKIRLSRIKTNLPIRLIEGVKYFGINVRLEPIKAIEMHKTGKKATKHCPE